MKQSKILVKVKSKKYPIYFGNDLLDNVGKIINQKLKNTKKIAIIADRSLSSKITNKLKFSLKKYKPKLYRFVSKDKLKPVKDIALSGNN